MVSGPIKPGDIYWVNIPKEQTVGREQYKRRPFVVVSRLKVNNAGALVVAVPLTSQGVGRIHPPYRIVVPSTEIIPDVTERSPAVDSVALADQVRVLDKTRLESKMGALSGTALAAVGLGLAYVFDL